MALVLSYCVLRIGVYSRFEIYLFIESYSARVGYGEYSVGFVYLQWWWVILGNNCAWLQTKEIKTIQLERKRSGS